MQPWEPAHDPAHDPALRASDADRDRYAEVVREAFAEGRLTYEEHSERLERIYASRTLGELAPIVVDLPVATTPVAVPRRPGMPVAADPNVNRSPIVAIFGGAERKGHWTVPDGLTTVAVFGGVELDLRAAVLTAHEVTINVTAIFGGIEITVPDGVIVDSGVVAILGGAAGPRDEGPQPPGSPILHVRGFAMFGGVDVKRKPRALPPTS